MRLQPPAAGQRVAITGEAAPAPVTRGLDYSDVKGEPFTYLALPGLVIVHSREGWRYAVPAPIARRGEPKRPLDYRGPFPRAADAARDIVATLGPQGFGRYTGAVGDSAIAELLAAIDEQSEVVRSLAE